ncbi:transcriptional regulator, XRE family [Candidatus Pantoea symbiotica]|jgi:transcriptional regulator with XRE-family HTH domain|uniref:Transcriptional regulator, XRE family n=1 Tax=Candidatus Pantoea symbiotica TaxID=1884370 RepID=A0A1I4D1C2_9GAMM|nr:MULTISPECIES: helix-turn-helix transcriptional regulator [Pantoea]KAJ9429894.1 helix-turn-helix transcriptional regulator [Pantoea sp. YR343]MRT25497.1 helix-turn-helix domain-containing protein [Enterobacteriaceae bacterium RIT697]SFK86660.1 transcriptional regulator, XRE family [Pantoea symbiotica]SFV04099.1 transcriptional regulator, XRE family [Pantoea sp. YR525]
MTQQDDNVLGNYLRERRQRLDAAKLGYTLLRRRTPGLRREEVAVRACVSTTWYTWLEQGRGGAPSEEVLERLARALELSAAERDHLFLLAQNRLPGVTWQAGVDVSPSLQRVLDSMENTPALVKTAEWQVVAWNRAATKVFVDYAELPPAQRNILLMMFRNEEMKERLPDWYKVTRGMVANFRADVARTGASKHVRALVEELCEMSDTFRQLWQSQEVSQHGEGIKQLWLPDEGVLELEYSTFAVEGKPGLSLVVFNPRQQHDRDCVARMMACP